MSNPGAEKDYGVILIPWPEAWGTRSGMELQGDAISLFQEKLSEGINPFSVLAIRTQGQAHGEVEITPEVPGYVESS